MVADTIIGRVGLRASAPLDLAQRLRVESGLSRLDLRPRTLPPSAIFVVRLLSSRAGADGRHHAGDLVQRLDALYRSAARPARQVADDAAAVVFASEAELLACVALDVVQHRAAERWWWRSIGLRHGGTPGSQLATFMAEHARAVPAALELLAGTSSFPDVARVFTAGEALGVLAALRREFRLDGVAAPSGAPTTLGHEERPPSIVPDPPWRPWLTRAAEPSGIAAETRVFVGTALGFVRAPSVVASAAYARSAGDWLAAQQALASRTTALAPSHASVTTSMPPTAAPRLSPRPMTSGTGPDREGGDGDSFLTSAREHAPGSATPRRTRLGAGHAAGADAARAQPDDSASMERLFEALPTARVDARAPNGGPGTPPDTGPPDVTPGLGGVPALDTDGVRTSFGGVFYLINVLLHLDLPRRPGAGFDLAALGAWGVLEAVSIALLDTLPEAAAAWPRWSCDAVWAQLGALGRRAPGRRLGEGLRRPRRYELPAAWAGSLPAGSRSVHRFSEAGAERLAPALRSWLARFVPDLRVRLCSSIGADAPDADGAVRAVLVRQGRLYVTGTHVDLVMPLETVSVAARKAGLDRDPGWQPIFGRVIKFHYE